MTEVTVALFGPSFDYGSWIWTGPSFEDHGPETPYAERLKFRLLVDESETLGSVIDRAAEHFGVTFTPAPPGTRISEIITGVVFYRPDDEFGLHRPEPWTAAIRLLDAAGQPSWAVPWNTVQYGELLVSADAGLVEGDPRRPYLWAVFPQGDVIGVLFEPMLWLLQRNYEFILKSAGQGAIAGASGWVVKEALNRLKRSYKARHQDEDEYGATPVIPRWHTRFERPDDFLPELMEMPRTTEEAAKILDCPTAEAEAVMWGLGFAFEQSDGRWRLGGDEPAARIAMDLEDVRRTGVMPADLESEALNAPPSEGE